jgi:glutamine---fructose-6-phosphate transaminase (isomerizing)
MCGLFGIISRSPWPKSDLADLVTCAEQRGRDSSGLLFFRDDKYHVRRADYRITKLLPQSRPYDTRVVMGHSRLITNGLADNQPVVREGICVLHNGIVVNHEEIWGKIGKTRELLIDTEVIPAIAAAHLEQGGTVEGIPGAVLDLCKGVIACALAVPRLGKLCLFSNNGSLYVGKKGEATYFSSERFPLAQLDCTDIVQVRREGLVLDIPQSDAEFVISNAVGRETDLIPPLTLSAQLERGEAARPRRARAAPLHSLRPARDDAVHRLR